MDIDGTRGARAPLSQEERRHRYDAGLCAYCGKPGHVSMTCPNRYQQARGTFQIPPGFQITQSQFPGQWHHLPAHPPQSQHSDVPPANPPASGLPKNSRPNQ